MKTAKFLILATIISCIFHNSINAQFKILSNNSAWIPAGQSYWINSTSDAGIRLRMHLNTGYGAFIDFYPKLQFRTGTIDYLSCSPLTLSSSGVGVFKDSPTCALDISGTARVNGAVVLTSDARLKENIQNMSGSLLLLSKLRGVTYNLKNPNANNKSISAPSTSKTKSDTVGLMINTIDSALYNRQHLGFLAQEIQKVFPELVYSDKDGILSVDYIGLIPVLAESLKELDNRTSDYSKLQQDLIDTKAKLDALERRLDKCCGKSNLKSQDITVDESITISSVLYQNVPNPFTQNTEIRFYLPETVKTASLYIYNMQGLQIKSIAINNRGDGKEIVSGSELKAGMYIYTLIADGKEVDTKRMILTE